MAQSSAPDVPAPAPEPRRRTLDNPRALTLAVLVLIAVLFGLVRVANRTTEVSPLLSDVVLYTLYAGRPGDSRGAAVRARAQPAEALVRPAGRRCRSRGSARSSWRRCCSSRSFRRGSCWSAGSEIISSSFDRWFSVPAEEIARGGQEPREGVLRRTAGRRRRGRAPRGPGAGADRRSRPTDGHRAGGHRRRAGRDARDLGRRHHRGVPVGARAERRAGCGAPRAARIRDALAQHGPRVGRSAGRARHYIRPRRIDVRGPRTTAARWCARRRRSGWPTGRPPAPWSCRSTCPPACAIEQRKVMDAYDKYQQVKARRGPLQGVYLAIYLMVALLILVSATWFGLYMAKRITRPVQLLAEGARAIGAGPSRPAHRARDGGRTRIPRRVVQHDGRRAAHESGAPRRVAPRARAQERRGGRAPALHRDDSRARGHRRHLARRSRRDLDRERRRGAAAGPRPARRSASRRASCSRARTCGRSCRWPTSRGGPRPPASCRKSRWRATTARFTSRPRRPCWPAKAGGSKAPCSCSTT